MVLLAPVLAAAQDEFPPPSGKAPLVVVFSGATGSGNYRAMATRIAALGYDVALFDSNAVIKGLRGPALAASVKEAIASARRLPNALPGKIGMVGFSMGGAVVLGFGSIWSDDVAVVSLFDSRRTWIEAELRADGVPLFIEERTRLVLASELVTQAVDRYVLRARTLDMAIPTTLHGSLVARLDRAVGMTGAVGPPQLLEIGAGDRPVLERRRDLRQFRVAHHRVAGDPELPHDDPRHERHPARVGRQRRQLQYPGRGLAELRRGKRLIGGQRLRRRRRRRLPPSDARPGEQREPG